MHLIKYTANFYLSRCSTDFGALSNSKHVNIGQMDSARSYAKAKANQREKAI